MYKLTAQTSIVITLLAGCTTFHPTDPGTAFNLQPDKTATTDCGNLLDYYATHAGINAEQHRQYTDPASAKTPQAGSSCDQLRLALLLSQPGGRARDREEAFRLLSVLLAGENNINQSASLLAQLLLDQLKQQQQQAVRIEQLSNSLKQESANSQALAVQLTELQSKLEQLKNIERNINEKEQAITAPATDSISKEPTQDSTGR